MNITRQLAVLGVSELDEDGFRASGRFGQVPRLFGGGGGKGGGGGHQEPVKPAPPPVVTDPTTQAASDVASQQMAAALNRGRTATMVTGGQGLSDLGTTSKTLLGN